MRMKTMQKWLCAVIICAAAVWGGGMQAKAGLPAAFENGYVHDYANILDAATVDTICDINHALAAQTGAEIMMVTMDFVPNGELLDAYATKLFNEWAVGNGALNNGVLVLFAIGDDNYGFSMGTGLERHISPGAAWDLLYEAAEDAFLAQDYNRSALSAVSAFEARLYTIYGATGTQTGTQQQPAPPQATTPARDTGHGQQRPVWATIFGGFGIMFDLIAAVGGTLLPIIAFIALLILLTALRGRRRSGYHMNAYRPRGFGFWRPRHHHYRRPHTHERYHMPNHFGLGGGFGRPRNPGGRFGGGHSNGGGSRLGGGHSSGSGGSRLGGGHSSGGARSGGGRTSGGGSSRGAGGRRR